MGNFVSTKFRRKHRPEQNNSQMEVDPLSKNPSAAWEKVLKKKKSKPFIQIDLKQPKKPAANNYTRIVCMSDTHSLIKFINFDIPEGDILIHAGDFTAFGLLEEVIEFNNWLGTLPHTHKIVIAGNHELSFESINHPKFSELYLKNEIPKEDSDRGETIIQARDYLTNCVYLQDSGVELYGLKFYGTPWQPESGNWAFNLPRGEKCLEKWNKIPDDTDILITHAPPLGHGDVNKEGERCGCVDLLNTVQKRVKPKYHIFGHIHEGYGVTSDGTTTYINASTCNVNRTPMNLPIVFDVELSEQLLKEADFENEKVSV